jgi:hypothetical protein
MLVWHTARPVADPGRAILAWALGQLPELPELECV